MVLLYSLQIWTYHCSTCRRLTIDIYGIIGTILLSENKTTVISFQFCTHVIDYTIVVTQHCVEDHYTAASHTQSIASCLQHKYLVFSTFRTSGSWIFSLFIPALFSFALHFFRWTPDGPTTQKACLRSRRTPSLLLASLLSPWFHPRFYPAFPHAQSLQACGRGQAYTPRNSTRISSLAILRVSVFLMLQLFFPASLTFFHTKFQFFLPDF